MIVSCFLRRLFPDINFISIASSPNRTTWHTILAFNPNAASFLKSVTVGSQVYVEANYELREADPNADPDTPAGQRQIFLRHGMYTISPRHELELTLFVRNSPCPETQPQAL